MAISLTRHAARDVLARCPDLGIGSDVPSGDGWLTAAELLEPAGLGAALDAMHARWSTPDRRVDGAFLTGHIAWYLSSAAIGPWLVDGSLLDLAPTAIAFHRGDGGLDGIAVDGDRAVRADASASALERELAWHTDLLVARMRAATPLGERAIRALTADALAGVFQWVGGAIDDERRAVETAETLLARPAWRWRGAFAIVDVAGRPERVHDRASCCLSYRCAGEEPCDTCPLRPVEDRRERARASLVDARALD